MSQQNLSSFIWSVADLLRGDYKLYPVKWNDTTDGDQVSYARTLAQKTMESSLLQKQAQNNTKEQFSNSPDLTKEIISAIIDSMDAQEELSKRALNSVEIQTGLKRILLGKLDLYESLRSRAGDTA